MTPESGGQRGFIPTESIQWDSSWPELENPNERRRILDAIEQRFGIPLKAFDDYLLFRRKKGWWLMRKSPHLVGAAGLKVEYAGIKAFHRVGSYVKPTTRMVQCFGSMATRAVVKVSPSELALLAMGEKIEKSLEMEEGYVILCMGTSVVLGVGLWYKGKLASQIPKKELRLQMIQGLIGVQNKTTGEKPS